MSDEVKARIEKRCEVTNRSRSDWCRFAILRFLEEAESGKAGPRAAWEDNL